MIKGYAAISNIVVCSQCGCAQFAVIDTRQKAIVRRRRSCLNCGNRITTYEISKEDFETLASLKANIVAAPCGSVG